MESKSRKIIIEKTKGRRSERSIRGEKQ